MTMPGLYDKAKSRQWQIGCWAIDGIAISGNDLKLPVDYPEAPNIIIDPQPADDGAAPDGPFWAIIGVDGRRFKVTVAEVTS